MLTGDKMETAKCIGISSGIKAKEQTLFEIKDKDEELEVSNLLNQFNVSSRNTVLVIDGTSLKTAIKTNEKLFFEVASKAPAVICCRCSPTQKAQITECLKKYTGKIIACIGDGGNDVGMIQAGDVGIGIVGKEGMQAALAADFSLVQFKHLNKLLLWHGRLSYKRSALLSQ